MLGTFARRLSGLEPLLSFRLKAGHRRSRAWKQRRAGVPASAGSLRGPSGPDGDRLRRCAALPALVLATALHASAATNATAPLVLDGVAAEVGEARVTIAETMLLAREMAAARQIPLAEQAGQLRALYGEALDHLVARQLVLQAYRSGENKLPAWAVDRRVDAFIDEQFGGDRSLLVSMLNKQRVGFDTWRQRMEEELVISTMRQQFVEQNVTVPAADVRAYYATNRSEFALDGPVRVGMILIAKQADETDEAVSNRASTVWGQLKDGQDFRAVAKRESAEAHAKEGGDWGYVEPEDVFRAEIADALAKLDKGAVSPPIPTESGIYIVTRLNDCPGGILPLAEAWPAIEARLRKAETERRFAAWIDSLKRRTTVRLHSLP